MKKYLALTLLLIVTSMNTNAKVETFERKPGLLAEVDGWAIPNKSLALYLNYQSAQDESLTKDTLLYNLIINRLLSLYALAEVAQEDLNDDSKVGYTSETALRDLFTALIRFNFNDEISKAIKATSKHSLSSYISSPFSLTKAQLKQVVTSKKSSLILVYRLNEAQKKSAMNTPLLKFQFPGEPERAISLLDIYQSGNIQEKIAIHNLDVDKVKDLIQRYMTSLYAHYWLREMSGLSALEIKALQDFISQNRIVGQYYRHAGFKAGIHDDNPRLKQVAQDVSLEEIKPFYMANKEAFKTVLKIRARHITLDSQSLADDVHAKLSKGMSFLKAVQAYSVADDKQKKIPGDLGWIERSGKKSWLLSLPFTQEKGQFSSAFMSPRSGSKKHTWEIVYVDDKEEGYYPADSETVRYQASRKIAEQKIYRHIMSLRSTLIKQASIHVPKGLLTLFDSKKDKLVDIDLFHQAHEHDHEDD